MVAFLREPNENLVISRHWDWISVHCVAKNHRQKTDMSGVPSCFMRTFWVISKHSWRIMTQSDLIWSDLLIVMMMRRRTTTTMMTTIYDYLWWSRMIYDDMTWHDIRWYDMIWYCMIWYDLIWYMISHDRAWLFGQIAFPQWPQWCVVVFSSSETLLVLCVSVRTVP